MQQSTDRNRILIVDDEPVNIQVLTAILQDEYDLNAATNGNMALKVAGKQRPDLILMDMVMPEMDGLEACKAFQADPATQDIPIIFVTSESDHDIEKAGFEAGAVDYILKPVSPPIVQHRVRIHLQNSLTVKFLEDLLSSRDISIEDAKNQAESLLVFV